MYDDVARVQRLMETMPQCLIVVDAFDAGTVRDWLVSLGVDDLAAEDPRQLLREALRERSCPICQCPHADGDRIVRLPCGHMLHHACAHLAAQESFATEKEKRVAWPRPRCPCCRGEIAAPARERKRRRVEEAPPPIIPVQAPERSAAAARGLGPAATA